MARCRQSILLLTILVFAIGLRFWRIDSIPPGFHLDEAYEGLEAWRILTDRTYYPLFLESNLGVPPLNAYANAAMFGLAPVWGGEAGPLAMRITAACFGVLGVLVLYALAVEVQRLDKEKVRLSVAFPCFAAASLAVMRWHFHFSRIGIEPILTPLLWAGATWLLLRGWRTTGWWSFAGAGLLMATCMYAYQAAWVIPLLLAPVAIFLFVHQAEFHHWRWSPYNKQLLLTTLRSRQVQGLLLALFVAVLIVVPFAWFCWQNWSLILLRPMQITLNGEGANAVNDTFGMNIWKTAKMFGPFGAPGDQDARRNLPGAPALNFWLALPFYLGLGLAIWRIRRPGYGVILLGLVGLLLPGLFSTHAPHFHRILGATAPTALLCGIGLDALWQWGRPRFQWVSLLLLVIGGATGVQEYFVQWAALPALARKFDVGQWAIAQTILAQPGTPRLYITPPTASYPTLNFAWQAVRPFAPVRFDGRSILPLTAQPSAQPEFYLVLEDEDFRTPLLLPEVFPNVRKVQEVRNKDGRVIWRLYERPAQALPQRPPQYKLTAMLGDGIGLLGYDHLPARLRPGKTLYLQLHWLVQTAPLIDWTVFIHLLHKDTQNRKHLVAGYDSKPGGGSLLTTQWQPGWRILDEYQIKIPATVTPGAYTLEIGLYQAGASSPNANASVDLGTLLIDP